jgi:hypothetical protein
MLRNVQPMLASPDDQPFAHPDWLFEVKWDGHRAIAEIKDGRVRLYSVWPSLGHTEGQRPQRRLPVHQDKSPVHPSASIALQREYRLRLRDQFAQVSVSTAANEWVSRRMRVVPDQSASASANVM